MKTLREAMDFAPGTERLINPQQRRKIEGKQEPVEKVLPSTSGNQSFLEQIGSAAFKQAIARLERYTGVKTPNNAMGLMGTALSTLQSVTDIESEHKDYLVQLAINTVLELPEFEPLKQMYENGDIEIEAELVSAAMPAVGHNEGEGATPEEEIEAEIEMNDEVQDEMAEINALIFDSLHDVDGEVLKRRFANIMTQGAAATNFEIFQYVSGELQKIDKTLPQKYGVLVSIIHALYWMMPDIGQAGAEQGMGNEEIEFSDTGKKTIRAKGICFPVLVHELVKGAMEIVADEGASDNSKVRKDVYKQADTIEAETIGLLIGSELYKKMLNLFSPEETKYMLYVYKKLLNLPVDDSEATAKNFVGAIKTILSDSPNAKSLIKKMISEVRAEIEAFESGE